MEIDTPVTNGLSSSKHFAKESSAPNGSSSSKSKKSGSSKKDKMNLEMDVDEDEDVARMMETMGFAGFKSTKNTKVPGNNVYGVRKEKKTEYRQYMNRLGGFNRPLSPTRGG